MQMTARFCGPLWCRWSMYVRCYSPSFLQILPPLPLPGGSLTWSSLFTTIYTLSHRERDPPLFSCQIPKCFTVLSLSVHPPLALLRNNDLWIVIFIIKRCSCMLAATWFIPRFCWDHTVNACQYVWEKKRLSFGLKKHNVIQEKGYQKFNMYIFILCCEFDYGGKSQIMIKQSHLGNTSLLPRGALEALDG